MIGHPQKNGFSDLVRGLGFQENTLREIRGEQYSFDLANFSDLMVPSSVAVEVKLKIFKTFEKGQEIKILQQIFELDGLDEVDFWQVELTS